MHNELGFSTGVFWQTEIKPISIEAIDHAYELSSSAIELGAARPDRWAAFESISPENILRFKYRSLHAPNHMTRHQAGYIRTIQNKYDLHTITMHPNPDEDWIMLREVGLRVGVENMDNRKYYGISPESIKKNNYRLWIQVGT